MPYVDPNAELYEQDEIEAVLGHCRDEGREDDPEDLWFENVVSVKACSWQETILIYFFPRAAIPYQMEGLFPPS